MGMAEICLLKQLGDENRKRKQPVANPTLDGHAPQAAPRKSLWGSSGEMVQLESSIQCVQFLKIH